MPNNTILVVADFVDREQRWRLSGGPFDLGLICSAFVRVCVCVINVYVCVRLVLQIATRTTRKAVHPG